MPAPKKAAAFSGVGRKSVAPRPTPSPLIAKSPLRAVARNGNRQLAIANPAANRARIGAAVSRKTRCMLFSNRSQAEQGLTELGRRCPRESATSLMAPWLEGRVNELVGRRSCRAPGPRLLIRVFRSATILVASPQAALERSPRRSLPGKRSVRRPPARRRGFGCDTHNNQLPSSAKLAAERGDYSAALAPTPNCSSASLA